MLMKKISVPTPLRHLILDNRSFRFTFNDLNNVLKNVAQNCKQLHTLEVYGGTLSAAVMCNLIISCPKLSVFHCSYLHYTFLYSFYSRKLSRLLLGNTKENKMRPFYFESTITIKDFCFMLQLILESVELYDVDRYAQLLFKVLRSHNYYRLKLDCETITRLLNSISNKVQSVCAIIGCSIIRNTNNNKCYSHLEDIDYYTGNFEKVL